MLNRAISPGKNSPLSCTAENRVANHRYTTVVNNTHHHSGSTREICDPNLIFSTGNGLNTNVYAISAFNGNDVIKIGGSK